MEGHSKELLSLWSEQPKVTILIVGSANQQTWMTSCMTENSKKATVRVIYIDSGSYIK